VKTVYGPGTNTWIDQLPFRHHGARSH